jgi:DNA polymerase-3 subunit alpha
VVEALIDAGACDSLGGHRAQLGAALDHALGEAQIRQQERDTGQVALFGDEAAAPPPETPVPDVPPLSEHERLSREKAVLGFFISGHPLARFRREVDLFSARTTATLGRWSDQPVTIGAVVTVVKRQISKKTGAEYARLVLEDFHGTAEALVFPDAWARLNRDVQADSALLLTGGYSARDRQEEQAPFFGDTVEPLEALLPRGAIGVALRWSATAPPEPATARAVAALCATHPGPAPLLLEGRDGTGSGTGATARLRSRAFRVDAADDLLAALRELLGGGQVQLVRVS